MTPRTLREGIRPGVALTTLLHAAAVLFACVALMAPAQADNESYFSVVQPAENVAAGVASAASSAAPATTTHVRIACLANAHVRFDSAAPTAAATDTLIVTSIAPIFRIAVGNKVAAIQDASATTCNITFLKANATTSAGNYTPGIQ